MRDYLDVVALAGVSTTAGAELSAIDDYYEDRSRGVDSVVTALVQRLSEPNPQDHIVTTQLAAYKGLDPKWHRWDTVVDACGELAMQIAEVDR